MNIEEIPLFTRILQRLSCRYDQMITKEILNEYWEALKYLELEDIKKAIHSHTQNHIHGSYWPHILDLKRIADPAFKNQKIIKN